MKGLFKTPCVPKSDLPALLGLESLHNSRCLLDINDFKVYFLGPGDYDLAKTLPPGTRVVQCEQAPSGHMMMPVDCYEALDKEEKNGGLELQEISLPVTKVTVEEPEESGLTKAQCLAYLNGPNGSVLPTPGSPMDKAMVKYDFIDGKTGAWTVPPPQVCTLEAAGYTPGQWLGKLPKRAKSE